MKKPELINTILNTSEALGLKMIADLIDLPYDEQTAPAYEYAIRTLAPQGHVLDAQAILALLQKIPTHDLDLFRSWAAGDSAPVLEVVGLLALSSKKVLKTVRPFLKQNHPLAFFFLRAFDAASPEEKKRHRSLAGSLLKVRKELEIKS